MEKERDFCRLCEAVLAALPDLAASVEASEDARKKLAGLLAASAGKRCFEPEGGLLPGSGGDALPDSDGDDPAALQGEGDETSRRAKSDEPPPWTQLLAEIEALRERFETRLSGDAHKEKLFDEMHRELTDFRNGAMEKPTDLMALDVVAVLDHLDGYLSGLPEQAESAIQERRIGELEKLCRRLLDELLGVQTDLTDILYKQGVEPFVCAELDPKRQRFLSNESAEKAAEPAHRVVRSLKPGYTRNGRLLRKELIHITFVASP